VTTSIDEIGGQKPQAAIVVYGETPYAEFQGDRETLEFSQPDAPHLQSLRRLHAANIPVISLFMSGRPLWVNRELNLSDAFVALWLPGTQGNGVADVLFKPVPGKQGYDFTGSLSFSWPATAMPVTFDANDQAQGALFPRGFGLSLSKTQELGQLPEDPGAPAALREKDTLFHAGHVRAPWSIYVADPVAEVRLTTQSQTSPESAVTVELQSPGVQVHWSGKGKGEFRIGGRAVRLPSGPGQALRLHYRVEEKPRQQVILSMRCETSEPVSADIKRCGVTDGQGVDLTGTFRSAATGSWKTLTVPLGCLRHEKSPAVRVNAPLALESSGEFGVEFDDIRWVRDPASSACPQ
jgi:beta-glucosidase